MHSYNQYPIALYSLDVIKGQHYIKQKSKKSRRSGDWLPETIKIKLTAVVTHKGGIIKELVSIEKERGGRPVFNQAIVQTNFENWYLQMNYRVIQGDDWATNANIILYFNDERKTLSVYCWWEPSDTSLDERLSVSNDIIPMLCKLNKIIGPKRER